MKKLLSIGIVLVLATAPWCHGQVGGNVSYAPSGGRARVEQSERTKRTLSKEELPPTATATFVEANVLMNVPADEFVAVFSLVEEAESVLECNRKMDATLQALTTAVKGLGVQANELFVDFVAQNKIYGYEVTGDVAREKLVGFELKKNVSLRYRDRLLIDKLVAAAAQARVFDLIKVDYVVKDCQRIHDQLLEEGARIVKHKMARYEKLLGIKLQPPAQVYAERSGVHYPTQAYDSYVAFESEDVASAVNRQKYAMQTARKNRTFYFNPLDGNGFDQVINPVVLEPMVQFTLYLKVKYEVEQVRAK